MEQVTQLEFTNPLLDEISFGLMLKRYPQKGNIVYEYNPFYNYRLDEDMYEYKDKLYTLEELNTKFGITPGGVEKQFVQNSPSLLSIPGTNGASLPKRQQWVVEENGNERHFDTVQEALQWKQDFYDSQNNSEDQPPQKVEWEGVPENENDPILIEAGSLVDFETDQLQFDIEHPVDIIPQYSYDGSVNLIFNDGKNIPRLVNSRFTTLAKNTYEVMDRKGNNDTNIYDRGAQFDIDTSLYKRVIEIPKLTLLNINSGGNLKCGNYTFYFKFADDDGNETDFVAESGLVSLFIGNDVSTVRQGFRDENTYKSVRFMMDNIDAGYSYVSVYYVRVSGDVDGNPSRLAYKIEKKFEINKALSCIINITGYEDYTEIPISDINVQYNIASAVEAQATCQNMLFFGNIHRPDINYKELNDLSLRFVPKIHLESYTDKISNNPYYSGVTENSYADPKFIYNYTGYMSGEIYRFGIVYILQDNSLSPVFNIRGINKLNTETTYTEIPVYKNENEDSRIYISSNEETGELITPTPDTEEEPPAYTVNAASSLENIWGVVRLAQDQGQAEISYINGIKIQLADSNSEYINGIPDTIQSLKNLGIKGFFFVRQKRIPIRLCQAITIGIENYSSTPVLPVKDEFKKYSRYSAVNSNNNYVAERFLNDECKLVPDFLQRIQLIPDSKVTVSAAICPEYDINPQYYNQLFTGSNFVITESNFKSDDHFNIDLSSSNHFYTARDNHRSPNEVSYISKVAGIPDDTTLIMIGDQKFRGRAGDAESAYTFQYLESKNKQDNATNMIRGSFGPYLGIVGGYKTPCSVINIHTMDYQNSIYDLFSIRHSDTTPFYAISERLALRDYDSSAKFNEPSLVLYRGDCYICTFTHRLNRNFQDPDAPTNDEIIDEATWMDNYKIGKKEELQKINRGDVNAIPMGMWVTFNLVSSMNLNVRALDHSYPTEEGLTGHKRGFHPYYTASTGGSYKIPESFVHNGGYTTSVGERQNFLVPDVPYIKNEFVTRILYSDIHINDAYKNGFRVFQLTHYRDYPRTYGSIIKLVELQGNLLCVFEHGVALIPVNERAVAGEGAGGNVFINTSNVLPENPRMLSDKYGSQWAESVISTPYFVYGVDTIGKKIWRTNGSEFEIISDSKVQKFLNDNISLSERELTPIIGVRNVKTHYNAFKSDVMFTFYDNLNGFEEKVWNLCYNELMQKFITFYSWVPSYSANIDNIFFSFNRDTSKWISKLGISKENNNFADGIVLSENIIYPSNIEPDLSQTKPGDEDIAPFVVGEQQTTKQKIKIGKLNLVNINIPAVTKGDLEIQHNWSIERDIERNDKNFRIDHEKDEDWLVFTGNYEDLKAYILYYNEDGKRQIVPPTDPEYKDKLVILLNIRCQIKLGYKKGDAVPQKIQEYIDGWHDKQYLDYGYYEQVVAVIPEDNLDQLTTDFWKHGQAGIIDIKDKILPTVWYGKQHPFEFEFVVAENLQFQKIFNNLQIISNKAKPESFHYEIVGECYEFSHDKKNMFIRQEATKAFYQYNGSDVLYDRKFLDLKAKRNPKSTIFPLYYCRQDRLNTIEDYYQSFDPSRVKDKVINTVDEYYKYITSPNKDFVNLSGSEIVYDELLGEFKVWVHAKAQDIKDRGRMRGNMHYLEDLWDIQINPIVFLQKNEVWVDHEEDGNIIEHDVPPISVKSFPIPPDLENTDIKDENIPKELKNYGYTLNDLDISDWNWSSNSRKETKLRDKYIKVRVRYSGEELAVITALKTLYTISYA